MAHLLLIGGMPGSGKSTLATELAGRLDSAVVVAGGAYLRRAASAGTEEARILANDAEIPIPIFRAMCHEIIGDTRPSTVINDGWPRSREQLEVLQTFVSGPVLAVNLQLSPEDSHARTSRDRFECGTCGAPDIGGKGSCSVCFNDVVWRPASPRRPGSVLTVGIDEPGFRLLDLDATMPVERLVAATRRVLGEL